MKAELKFQTLEHIVRVYQERGENLMGDLARPIAEALHHEVLEVFETEGYGTWPGFWWQRAGLPKPGTPIGVKYGPAKPDKALTARTIAMRAKKEAKRALAAKREKKLRASFGHVTGAVERRYGGVKKPTRSTKSKRIAKSYRRWQGNPKLLRDRGILIGSLTPFTAEDLIEVYTNVPYAKYHVSPEPRHKIPLRDFFDIDRDAFERDIVDMIDIHLGRPITVAA